MPKKKQEPPTVAEAAEKFRLGVPMTSVDLAVYLGMDGTDALDTHASRGTGPVYSKPGACRLYDPKDVQKWLDDAKRASVHSPAQEKRAA